MIPTNSYINKFQSPFNSLFYWSFKLNYSPGIYSSKYNAGITWYTSNNTFKMSPQYILQIQLFPRDLFK